MANKIIIKNGAGAPGNGVLSTAELGFDTQNKLLYIGDSESTNLLLNPPEVTVDLEGANQGSVNGINADTLGGKLESALSVADSARLGGQLPSYYATKDDLKDFITEIPSDYAKATKLTPRNLLDNSDFSNPVNQRGQTSYLNGGYTIDRWRIYNTGDSVVVQDGYISKTGNLIQMLEGLDANKQYTAAICENDGTISVYNGNGSISGGIGGWAYKIYCNVGSTGMVNFRITSNANDIKWAALYEGEYTIDTLPEYQPKGYGAELAECQRYFQYHKRMDLFGYVTTSSTDYCMFIDLPVPMRIRPTVAISDWIARTATGGYSKYTSNTPKATTALRTYGGNDTDCSHLCICDRIAASAGDTNNSILAYTVNELTFSADL